MTLSNLPDIFFIRHGETDWNAQGRYQGRQDIPLNARGQEQADANGPLMRGLLQQHDFQPGDFDWYMSPLSRTRETMDRVRKAFDHQTPEPAADDRLIEISFGKYEGSMNSDLLESGILQPGERGADFWHFRPEEGENYEEVSVRIRSFVEDLNRPSIVVAHGGVARVFRHIVEGASHKEVVNWPTPQNAVLHFSGGKLIVHESDAPGAEGGVFANVLPSA